jgi:hypothetical protein
MLIVLAPRFEFRLHRNRSAYSTAQNRYLEQEVYLAGNLSASLLRILVGVKKNFKKLIWPARNPKGRFQPTRRRAVLSARLRHDAPPSVERNLFPKRSKSSPDNKLRIQHPGIDALLKKSHDSADTHQ